MVTHVDLSASQQGNLRATQLVMIILAVAFVGLRFASRYMKGFSFGMDDLLIVSALILLFVIFGITLLGLHYGLGRHAAALQVEDLMSYGKTLMAFECVYVTCITLVKCSLLTMYYRIFPIRSIKIGAYILAGVSISWAISICMVSIFQCTPIAKTWNPTLDGHCINLKASFIGNAIPNILTDILILALPMPQIWKLHTTVLQRAQICFVFLLGSFVIFTSIYRFTQVFRFQADDVTWTLASAQIWCLVESSAAIISACLPTLGPLFQFVVRSLKLTSSARNSSNSRSRSRELKTIRPSVGGGIEALESPGPRADFDDASKLSDGRNFQRLHRASGESGDTWSKNSGGPEVYTVEVGERSLRHKASEDSDEILLRGTSLGKQTKM
ncbi:integral membrane protein [Phlyctema vagabunda]|uniref:Integral membrane protein n=1 Tax=Phlyctema vagabunda TaxID=108571 RepID=A0ABR4PB23_9HELO